jgi:DNA-binding LytR/AlgR family response regulator
MPNGVIHLIRTSLDTALRQLPDKMFLKVHRSFAVSVLHIVAIDRQVLEVHGLEQLVPVSKKYYPEFIKQVTIIGSV